MNDEEWTNLRETLERHADLSTKEFRVYGTPTGIGTNFKVEFTVNGQLIAYDITDYSCW